MDMQTISWQDVVHKLMALLCQSHPRHLVSILNYFELYSIFYKGDVKKNKIIPDNIYNLLTPIALAHLIMGDGSARPHGLTICTNNYSLKDVVKLMNVLNIF